MLTDCCKECGAALSLWYQLCLLLLPILSIFHIKHFIKSGKGKDNVRNFVVVDLYTTPSLNQTSLMGSCIMYNGRDFLSPCKTSTMLPTGMLLRQPLKCPEIRASSQSTANEELCKGGRYLSSPWSKRMAVIGTYQWEAAKMHQLDKGITTVTRDKCGTGIVCSSSNW